MAFNRIQKFIMDRSSKLYNFIKNIEDDQAKLYIRKLIFINRVLFLIALFSLLIIKMDIYTPLILILLYVFMKWSLLMIFWLLYFAEKTNNNLSKSILSNIKGLRYKFAAYFCLFTLIVAFLK